MTARERLLSYGLQHDTSVEVQKFIESAILDHAEAVREECAKWLDEQANDLDGAGSRGAMNARDNLRAYAAAIRAIKAT